MHPRKSRRPATLTDEAPASTAKPAHESRRIRAAKTATVHQLNRQVNLVRTAHTQQGQYQTSDKIVKGTSHSVEEQRSAHSQKAHATSQPCMQLFGVLQGEIC